MAQRKYPLGLCLLAFGALTSAPTQAADIERVVVGAHDTFTRVVFHLDESATYSQTWDSSGRPVITLPNVSSVGPQPDFTTRHAPAVGLTYALSDDGLDAVIVTDGPVKATSFILTPDSYGGHRVVIDVSRTGADQATGSIGGSPSMRRLEPEPGQPDEQLAEDLEDAEDLEEIVQASPQGLPEQTAPPEPTNLLVPETTPDPESPPLSAPTPLTQTRQPDPPAQEIEQTPTKPDLPAREIVQTPAQQEPPARTQLTALETDLCAGTAGRLQMDRWDMGALIDHGLCLSGAGRLVDARGVLERILSFDPEFHRARLALADVYKRQGEIALAKEAYEYVLLTSPPADVTKRIQMALRELRPRETTAAAPLP